HSRFRSERLHWATGVLYEEDRILKRVVFRRSTAVKKNDVRPFFATHVSLHCVTQGLKIQQLLL
ncbi:MAG TPA: hypothetical protein VJA22_03805, partial [Patescibacteria group bacterium]|nr:hypothetical protein [Patescibacteria group bacterium]